MDQRAYTDAWNKEKIHIHIMPDTPEITLAQQNRLNTSLKHYKQGYEDAIRKGYYLPKDAISVLSARASRDIISDYKYKTGYRKQLGHHIGARCVQDDPLIMKAFNAAKISSDLVYKKDFEKSKTKFHLPVDMLMIEMAKKCQIQVNDFNYRTYLHNWTCLPDSNDVVQARKVYDLRSDAVYKADLEWLRGCGWMPQGSLDVIKVKKAQTILNDRLYRQPPSTVKFTSVVDLPAVVLAKQNAETISDRKYKEAWEKDKTSIHIMPDTPAIELSKANAINISNRLYTKAWDASKAKGYHIKQDAISVLKAKASRDIASDYKYKAGYRKQVGHHIGALSVKDDPLLMLALNSARIASDALYKKDFEKSKTKFHLPVDMLMIEMAKKCQIQVNDFNYRTYLHNWTCLPDSNDVVQARKVYDLRSDIVYKSDLEWLKGVGWIPHESMEVVKVRNAQKIVSDYNYKAGYRKQVGHHIGALSVKDDPLLMLMAKKLYDLRSDVTTSNIIFIVYKSDLEWIRGCGWIAADSVDHVKVRKAQIYKKNAVENFAKYTHIVDRPEILLAKVNAANLSDLKYKESFNLEKGKYIGSEDTPQLAHSREMAKNISEKLYKSSWDTTKATSYQLNEKYLPLVGAKHSRDTASMVKYKDAHEKAKGHYMASIGADFPEVVRAAVVEKMKGEYHKAYESTKTKLHIPVDMISTVVAKKCQEILSDVLYRTYLHQWTCHPDQSDAIQARKANEILSDVFYKDDLNWMKGIGCYVWDTPEIVRAKKSYELQSDMKYRAEGKKNFSNYSIVTDTPVYVTAVQGHTWASDLIYKEAYNKEKHLYTTILDTFDYTRCSNLKDLFSNRLYKEAWEKIKASSYKVPVDSNALVHAKEQKAILSKVKYRENYEKTKHAYTLPKCLEDDPQAARCVKVGKLNLDRLYKSNYEQNKAKVHLPPDMLDVVAARQTQDSVSEINYRKYLHQWICLPDMQVYAHARKVNEQLSDIFYKEDMAWVKGAGCYVWDTPEILRCKHANTLQSEGKYRAKGIEHFKNYTVVLDTPTYETCKQSAVNLSDVSTIVLDHDAVSALHPSHTQRLYREQYEKEKDKIHTTHDTPEIRQVKANQEAISDLCYKEKYYNSRGSLISMPITPELMHCYHVNEITSDLKYKEDLKWLKGIGCFLYDTPEIVHIRKITKFRTNYPVEAKKMREKYSVVLDTPEYTRVTELKNHLSELVYRAQGNEQKTKCTTPADSIDIQRVKWAQLLTNKYKYVDLASKERAHYTPELNTPVMEHARHMKVVFSEKKYKDQYEKMKHRYTSIADTPILVRAKKAYLNASDLRYKEIFETSKGRYRTVKDAINIVYHRKVTDDISEVKYREKYISSLGLWRSIPDRPELFHHKMVRDAVSDIKYKEDLDWLKGIGCYVWDTPDLVHAGNNKALYSEVLHASTLSCCSGPLGGAMQWLHLTPWRNEYLFTQRHDGDYHQPCHWKYKEKYEREKSKFTSLLETPENETHKRNKKITDIIYKMEYNKNKAKGYTLGHDTPVAQHMRRVKDIISTLKYKETYEREKSHINIAPDAYDIRAAKEAYKNISNLDYKKKYEATKAKWIWTVDRPDFIHAVHTNLQQSDVEYKYDRQALKGCKLSVADDKYTTLAKHTSELTSDVKYKEKYMKARGTYQVVSDTPQILLAKSVATLISENKYKEASKKEMQSGSFTTLPQTRDTTHSREITKLVSGVMYKKKFEEEKGKAKYNIMVAPPDVKHAMDVAKNQSNYAYKQEAKAKLHYTPVADRPDIKKATQAAKLISEIGYREKARQEAARGGVIAGRPDITLATKVSKLTSQLKYKEKFDKEMKGKKPEYDLQKSKIYQTLKDANTLASEIKYKGDLKKIHKPVTDMAESLSMQHGLSTSRLASDYQYKNEFEESKGHYHMVPDTPEQIHLKEASELQSQVKYKEKYQKERGKPMLDFETPTYVTAKEAQHMQSQKDYKKDFEEYIKGRNLSGLEVTPAMLHVRHATKIASEKVYRRDLEEGVRGKGLTVLEETPELLRAKNATQILNEKEYKKALEYEIKGKGMLALATDTPDFQRARNATDILSQAKYKQTAEMDRSSYTTVIDTPDIIHAQQIRNIISQKKYKEEAERTMCHYVPVLDTPEMQRVRENQRNFSTLQYQTDLRNIKGKVTVVHFTPEMLRVKENQKNFSTIKYKDLMGWGTAVADLPEVKRRVKRNQQHISSVFFYKCLLSCTPTAPQVLYSDSFRKQVQGKAAFVLDTPEMRRVKETQRIISGVRYHQEFEKSKGSFTPVVMDPITERVKKNMQDFSDISYRGIQRRVVEMERRRTIEHDQETITDLRVWRTNPGSVFDYDPAEDNIQSRSLHMLSVQAQRRSKEHSRSTSAMSIGDEKSEGSENVEHHLSVYSNGFPASSLGYQHAKTVEVQQRSSSVATQQTTVSSIPSHPSTTGKTVRAMYDYIAADQDEVSFKDGDVIVNVQSIDEGWMYGTVQRTGKTGMLPANYVEAI
uniref:Nebulin n=1 Tax=Scleropages formosus TaxID=113540 RepID=A0A8C9R1Q6_SCLFO